MQRRIGKKRESDKERPGEGEGKGENIEDGVHEQHFQGSNVTVVCWARNFLYIA